LEHLADKEWQDGQQQVEREEKQKVSRTQQNVIPIEKPFFHDDSDFGRQN